MAGHAPPPQPVRPPTTWASGAPHGGPQWQNNQQMVEVAPDWNSQPPATVTSQASELHGTLTANNQPALPLESAQITLPSPQQTVQSTRAMNSFALMQLVRRARLPSGLDAVSSAAIVNRLLVVDSAGSVFLSQDEGKHWETVVAQWRGKAIEVQAPLERQFTRVVASPGLRSAASTEVSVSPSDKAGASPPAPPLVPASGNSVLAPVNAKSNPASASPPPMFFTLVTDRHQSWVSADGKIWRERDSAPSPPAIP